MATYSPVPAGPDLNLLNSLDATGTHWIIIQGGLAVRTIFGIYHSLRITRTKTNGRQHVNPILPIVYLLLGGLWYLVTD